MTKKSKQYYYTLIVRTPEEGAKWTPQFGDYHREVCVDQMVDCKDNGEWPKGTQFKVIRSAPGQVSIDREIRIMNEAADFLAAVEKRAKDILAS